jgi:cell division protein FtsI/penicillin-binding protein 2
MARGDATIDTIRFSRSRILFLGVVFGLGFAVLAGRLFTLQVLRGKQYQRERQRQSEATVVVPADRGNLYDRALRPLALSSEATTVGVRPPAVSDVRAVERALLALPGLDAAAVRSAVRSNRPFEWVARRVSVPDSLRHVLSGLSGVDVFREAGRVYPMADRAAQVIGATTFENRGAFGLEFSLDEILSGKPGRRVLLRTATNRALPDPSEAMVPPEPGLHVVLTLDARLQGIVEYELARGLELYGARRAAAVFLQPSTGEVLALAEVPVPHRNRPLDPADWNLRSVTGMYEPGSTFKLLTAACLLEEGLVDPDQLFFGENGVATFGGRRIEDPHHYGWLTFREAFQKSSNICMAKAAEVLLPKEYYRFLRRAGFGSPTGILLAAESPGSLKHYGTWSGRTLTSLAFGYEIGVTPLQMAAVYAAVANGGVRLPPRIVEAVVNREGQVVRRFRSPRGRRIFSPAVCRILESFCAGVVSGGTGTAAAVPGIEVCGKTGTSQKVREEGGYDPSRHVASFVGFAPRESPSIVGMVLYDEPDYAHRWGGSTAAPTFARILETIVGCSDLMSRAGDRVEAATPRTEPGVPNFLQLRRDEAVELARNSGVEIELRGEGDRVLSQSPAPGVSSESPPTVRLFVPADPPPETDRDEPVTVPDLAGLSAREARRALNALGLAIRLEGSGRVVSQRPRAGGRLVRGASVRVECSLTSFHIRSYPEPPPRRRTRS